jgi:ABC-2 type transport system ATP-binding protein
MISAAHLVRTFGRRTAVRDVSLEVGRSEIVALLGPNGAGKTTTLRMLAGLIAPTSGTIAIDGVALNRWTAGSLRARIGFLTESPGLWDRLTVRENLTTYARLYSLQNADRAVGRVMASLAIEDRADTRAAELSKGMRQKVALARALVHEPAVLLLDEPTTGLDPEIARGVRQILDERRAAGCAILVSTHNLDEAERLADRVAVLHERLVAVDRPVALRQRLMTGRLIVRVAGDPARHLKAARRFDPMASIEGATLVLAAGADERRTPAIVAALVADSADILEVRPETPALEDVYLHLMREERSDVR